MNGGGSMDGNDSFEVIYYKSKDGSCPVNDFLDELTIKMQYKVLRDISLLRHNGNELREPHAKVLDDGICELRSKQGTDAVRILYFFIAGRKIILTNGFVKKTQKTPIKEIERAKNYRTEYLKK